MPTYTYISRNGRGERVTAVMEAESRNHVLTQLKNLGLTAIDVQQHGEKKKAEVKSKFAKLMQTQISFRKPGVGTGELAIFWRQFSTMIDAGLSMTEALEGIAQEVEHPVLKSTLTRVVSDLWEGLSLSLCLEKHPKVFSKMVVALVAAAEESGSLPEVADQIATFLEKRDDLIRKVRTALTYPIFLVSFFLALAFVATFWIIPRFDEIYSSFEAKLPWFTEVVFTANKFCLSNFHWFFLALVSMIAAIVIWARKPEGRRKLDAWSLRIPLFGKLFHRAAIARFCRSLSILLYGGVPVNRALEMIQETTGNQIVAESIFKVREEIMQGTKFAAALRNQPIFPRMTVRMVAVGEETGNLTGLLKKTAEFYEARVDAALATINTLIEPIIIVLIGAFVLVFVLALYMPIFTLGAAFKG